MIDYQKVLNENPSGVMATIGDGKAKTRVFQYLFADGNRVYFCTSNEKPVYSQIQANPYVSFCTCAADFSPVLSVNGRAVFVDDLPLKARALDENPSIKDIYHSPGNPSFELFYIDVEEVVTFSFADGPQTYAV